MSWLKTVGTYLATGRSVVAKVEGLEPFVDPILRGLLPKGGKAAEAVEYTEDALTKVGGAITTVEGVITASQLQSTGADKLRAAAPLVMEIVKGSELMVGKKIKDQAAYEKACVTITSGVADLLNSLEEPPKP